VPYLGRVGEWLKVQVIDNSGNPMEGYVISNSGVIETVPGENAPNRPIGRFCFLGESFLNLLDACPSAAGRELESTREERREIP
jgi:hypothetical protein